MISKVIYRKKYTIKRKGMFFLVSDGSVKFLIHKKLFNKVVDSRSRHKILEFLTKNKELIVYSN